eukprot:Seg5217.3 transcript_id=Seg5217.3/GoldUCD/mRNA.D3Y31 product="Retrovirus-related Pol polyprotein from transposon 17.6" protein_id=Seg5217.3/GoldUCD/D3Y31
MDDIVIFSKTFEEHLQSIEAVFERMQESNIALKLSKCIFASHKVDFLGFELSNSGIRPQSRLTDAISKFEQPKTKKEQKGFLGLAGFYHAFIRNFANIAEPLNNLTSDKIPFAWTNECTGAFNALKRALLSDPVLRFPNLQQEFVVEVEASNYAYIQAVPLKDQTAPTITEAFERHWVYIHRTPHYLLTDQGSKVDGQLMPEICNTVGIEKRRSSASHSQGNGFAERNIRSVKDVLRAVLLHRKLQQSKWHSLLPSLVFALNTSKSKATGCIPYSVVFGRSAVLLQDVLFQQANVENYDLVSPKDYEKDITPLLRVIFDHVITKLEISKENMQRQYNTKLRFIDYSRDQKVWLKVKYNKTVENRKLAPRRTGPWKVIQKLPNGVNFEIENSNGEKKVVHHDRI